MNAIQSMLPLLVAVLVFAAVLRSWRAEAVVRALGIATRRCVTCAEHARCDAALDAADWGALREICPNTSYMDGLRAVSPADRRAAGA